MFILEDWLELTPRTELPAHRASVQFLTAVNPLMGLAWLVTSMQMPYAHCDFKVKMSAISWQQIWGPGDKLLYTHSPKLKGNWLQTEKPFI